MNSEDPSKKKSELRQGIEILTIVLVLLFAMGLVIVFLIRGAFLSP